MPHFSLYQIFLGVLTLAGIATTVWGWLIIAKGRRMKNWPRVEGIIENSKRGMTHHDLLPEIVFSYTVLGRNHTCIQEFPASLTPNKEFTDSYLGKYPVGAKVGVKYDPATPEHATLEGAVVSDDWMVFLWGLAMIAIGIVFLTVGE